MLLAVAPDESDRPPAERRGWDNIQINTYEVVDAYLPMADCAEVMAKLQVRVAKVAVKNQLASLTPTKQRNIVQIFIHFHRVHMG